jgi:hypothetical protein
MSDPACGRIKDPYTDRMWILIAGGFDAALDVNTNRVWLWDPENNEVRAGPALPAANDGMHLIEYTETEVLVVGGYHGDQVSIYSTIIMETKSINHFTEQKKLTTSTWICICETV